MEKLIFKIKNITQAHYPKIKFSGKEDKNTIYEGYNAYRPVFKIDTNILLYYTVYFYKGSGYWEYLNQCTIEDFYKYIKPRLDGKEEEINK
jgi:hypothetical protein